MKNHLVPLTAFAAILSITAAANADITVTQRITMDGIPEMAGGGPAPAPAPKPAPKPAPTKKPAPGKKVERFRHPSLLLPLRLRKRRQQRLTRMASVRP